MNASGKILEALSDRQWWRTLDLCDATKIGIRRLHVALISLEEDGLVECRYEDAAGDPARQGRPRKVVRITEEGGKRVRERQSATGWGLSPATA